MGGQTPTAYENLAWHQPLVFSFSYAGGSVNTEASLNIIAPVDMFLEHYFCRWETASSASATGHFAKVADAQGTLSTNTDLITADAINFAGAASTYVTGTGLPTANLVKKGELVILEFGDAPDVNLVDIAGTLIFTPIRH